MQGKLLQKMIVFPLFTFIEFHEIGVQIEDVMKQGLLTDEKEQPKRAFTCSSNAATSSNATAKPSDVGMVITTSKTANTFAGTSETTSQATKHQP